MTPCHRLANSALACALCAAGGVLAATQPATAPLSAAAASAPDIVETRARTHGAGDAVAQCEAAVGDAIREMRGKQVLAPQFEDDARAARAAGDQLDVKGTGRYRRTAGAAPVAFRYSCAFNEATGVASGVLFHEMDKASEPPPLPVWQADISKISPESCETAAASALQSSHPRASGIVFDGNTRKLEPAPAGGTALAGSGQLVRAPGMQPSGFKYRCEFDAAGKVVSARAND
jgi:hypothetical protein